MGHIVFKNWGNEEDDYRYGEQLAEDVAVYFDKHPSASVEEVIRAFEGKWSEDGIRHHLTGRTSP